MNAYSDWYLWRGLVFLLMLGVFVLFALVTAFWQTRRARRTARSDKAPADPPLARSVTTDSRDRVAADRRPVGREVRSVAAHERRAA
jgi:type VI protein secretion system component VasK